MLLDAGDPFQGSLFYTTYKGAAEAEFMEDIGYDVMAVGNHEFDDGPPALADFIDMVSFPVISGNLDLSSSDLLKDRVQNHVVLEVGGQRIGVISALATDTDETSSPGPNVTFQDEIDSLAADAQALTDEGVDIIIALNHVGLPLDRRIAAAVPQIDAIIGGHSHTLMTNDDADTPAYPEMIEGTPVAQAYAYTKYLGELNLTFDDAGNVIEATGEPILLDASVTPDPEMSARIAEMGAPIEEMKTEVVAESATPIIGSREVCRSHGMPHGQPRRRRHARPRRRSGHPDRHPERRRAARQHRGGRGHHGRRPDGAAVPEHALDLRGHRPDHRGALENGVGQVAEGAGRFPQVAGMSFTVDLTAEPGSRISEVMVDGEPIDPGATYGVVSNNYVRNGGDGYAMFVGAENAYDYGPDLADVTADYLAENSPYEPYTDGRITVISE